MDDTGHGIDPPGGAAALRARFSAQRGDWFSRGTAGRFALDVQWMYRDLGYANVDVHPTLTQIGDDMVEFDVTIRRGVLVRVRRIDVRGTVRVPESAVRAEVQLAAGSLYSETGYQRTLTLLRRRP